MVYLSIIALSRSATYINIILGVFMRKRTLLTSLLLSVLALFVIGCGNTNKVDIVEYDVMRSQLEEKEQEVSKLKTN